jgi:hypothetical protein
MPVKCAPVGVQSAPRRTPAKGQKTLTSYFPITASGATGSTKRGRPIAAAPAPVERQLFAVDEEEPAAVPSPKRKRVEASSPSPTPSKAAVQTTDAITASSGVGTGRKAQSPVPRSPAKTANQALPIRTTTSRHRSDSSSSATDALHLLTTMTDEAYENAVADGLSKKVQISPARPSQAAEEVHFQVPERRTMSARKGHDAFSSPVKGARRGEGRGGEEGAVSEPPKTVNLLTATPVKTHHGHTSSSGTPGYDATREALLRSPLIAKKNVPKTPAAVALTPAKPPLAPRGAGVGVAATAVPVSSSRGMEVEAEIPAGSKSPFLANRRSPRHPGLAPTVDIRPSYEDSSSDEDSGDEDEDEDAIVMSAGSGLPIGITRASRVHAGRARLGRRLEDTSASGPPPRAK